MLPARAEPILRTSNENPFASFGEQLHAVARAGQGFWAPDPRLLQVRASAAGASEMVPADGGFLVAPDFSREIVRRMYLTGNIFNRCFQVPTTSSPFQFPQFDESSRVAGARLGGIQAFWENEGANLKPEQLQGTDYTQKPSFNLSTLTAKKITGYLHCTDELSMDSDAFGTWASYCFAQELQFKIEGAVVSGTGAGMPEGIMKSPALVSVTGQPGQQSGTVVAANVEGMLGAFWAASYHSDNAIWLYNQALLPQLANLQTVVGVAGSQSSLWSWRSGGDRFDRLAGIFAMQCEQCAVPGTPGDLILCDLSRYILAMRETRSEVSIHVRFVSDQSTFRFVIRCDGQTIDRSAVQPANGTQVTSPFVSLGGR